MKQTRSTATLALFAAGIIGGLAPIGAKIALRELPPATVLFVRLSMMLVVIMPIAFRGLLSARKEWKKLLVLGLAWIGNVTLFIIGIKYATSTVSQIVYMVVPGLVIAGQFILFGTRTEWYRILGTLISLAGAVPLIYRTGLFAGDGGSLYGNALVLGGAVSWSAYLLVSKRLSGKFSSVTLTAASALLAWLASILLMAATDGTTGLMKLPTLSVIGWMALAFLGLIVGGTMIFLYQYGLKKGEPLVASGNVFLSIIVATVAGNLLFGEYVTPTIGVSFTVMGAGLFLTSILPLLRKPS